MDGWSQVDNDTDEREEIVVGRRRMRVGRRRTPASPLRWVIIGVVVVLVAGGAVAAASYFNRRTGLAALPNPAVVTPGGFRASIGAKNTITVGLGVRNVADVPITLVQARIVAPAGLTSTNLTIVPTGPDNVGFTLTGALPPAAPVTLGVATGDRNAIIVARFVVSCPGLLAAGTRATGEQIFVTVKVGQEQRTEELTPPVVGDVPWLTATARRVCLDPLPTTSAQPPLPPLSDHSVGSGTAQAR